MYKPRKQSLTFTEDGDIDIVLKLSCHPCMLLKKLFAQFPPP